MRALTEIEQNEVSGGNPALVVTIVIACIGAAYMLGKDMAERDNARDN